MILFPTQASEDTLRAREKILEAAGGLVATLESSVGYNKEGKVTGIAANDLEVIQEEGETKIDATNTRESAEDDKEHVRDSNMDPLGIADVKTTNEGNSVNDLEDDSAAKAKHEDSGSSLSTGEVAEKDDDSNKIPMPSDDTIQDLVSIDTEPTEDSSSKVEESDSLDIFAKPGTAPEEKELPSSSSSSSEANEPSAIENLESFSPQVNLNFED